GRVDIRFRHRVNSLVTTGATVTGAYGDVLEPTTVQRGQRSGRESSGEFQLSAGAVLVTSGGIGGNFELVRKAWPADRLGPAPKSMIAGVPHHVDGRMVAITQQAGAAVINADRMWHYTEGVRNWAPIWPEHGIR